MVNRKEFEVLLGGVDKMGLERVMVDKDGCETYVNTGGGWIKEIEVYKPRKSWEYEESSKLNIYPSILKEKYYKYEIEYMTLRDKAKEKYNDLTVKITKILPLVISGISVLPSAKLFVHLWSQVGFVYFLFGIAVFILNAVLIGHSKNIAEKITGGISETFYDSGYYHSDLLRKIDDRYSDISEYIFNNDKKLQRKFKEIKNNRTFTKGLLQLEKIVLQLQMNNLLDYPEGQKIKQKFFDKIEEEYAEYLAEEKEIKKNVDDLNRKQLEITYNKIKNW